MSEVLKRVVCVRLAMSESLSRSRRPTAEGHRLHRAGVACGEWVPSAGSRSVA